MYGGIYQSKLATLPIEPDSKSEVRNKLIRNEKFIAQYIPISTWRIEVHWTSCLYILSFIPNNTKPIAVSFNIDILVRENNFRL